MPGQYEWNGRTYFPNNDLARVAQGKGNIFVGTSGTDFDFSDSDFATDLTKSRVLPPPLFQFDPANGNPPTPIQIAANTSQNNSISRAEELRQRQAWPDGSTEESARPESGNANGTVTNPDGTITTTNITANPQGFNGTITVFDPSTGIRTTTRYYNHGTSVNVSTVQVLGAGTYDPAR